MTDDSTSIAWRAIVYDTPVLAADGSRIGAVREVLGSDQEDIFHGIRVRVDGKVADDVLLPADRVSQITAKTVTTDLAPAGVSDLHRYDDEATYHLASVGWLRRHVGWKKDAESDEGPG